MNILHVATGIAALLALLACLAAPILYFVGSVDASTFKTFFLIASLGWFIFAWLWAREKEPGTI